MVTRLPTPAMFLLSAMALWTFGELNGAKGQTSPNHTSMPDCDHCHTQKNPTPGASGLRACSRQKERQHAKALEDLGAPRVVILDELQNLYLPVPFDHAGHAEMAKMGRGCVTCHHYTPEGSQYPACKTCHAIGKNTDIAKPGLKGAYHRQCLSCHREWSSDSGCNACHQSKTSGKGAVQAALPSADDIVGRMHPPIPEPDQELYVTAYPEGQETSVLFRHREHIHRYHLRCSECHHEDNCGSCHGQGKEHVQRVRTVEEHHAPCMSCHQQDACESCHFSKSAGAPPPFDHAATGWLLKSYHADESCRSCHTAVPFQRLDTTCNACHREWNSGNFKHAVTGQVLDASHEKLDCASCHKDLAFGKPPACDECHEEDEAIAFPAKRPGPVMETKGG